MLKLSSCEVRHVNHIITCLLTVSCKYFTAVCLILLLFADSSQDGEGSRRLLFTIRSTMFKGVRHVPTVTEMRFISY